MREVYGGIIMCADLARHVKGIGDDDVVMMSVLGDGAECRCGRRDVSRGVAHGQAHGGVSVRIQCLAHVSQLSASSVVCAASVSCNVAGVDNGIGASIE